MDRFELEQRSRRRRSGDPRKEAAPPITKLAYGSLLAASLAYMMIRQQDAVGLCLFDDVVRTLIPHRSVRKQLFHILQKLEALQQASHKLAEQIYQAAKSQQAADAGEAAGPTEEAAGADEAKEGEDVVDADFEVKE